MAFSSTASSLLVLLCAATAHAAEVRASVDFSKHIRDWDGFGINYVETAQTRDYKADPQEYGGFSLLSETDRRKVIDMIFGADGLKPGLLKMFLDPWHEPENDNADPNVIDASRFDHKTTTQWLRYFAREGLKATRARGGNLSIITTLYGPPAWMTKQGFIRGRDLDPSKKYEAGEYMIAWVKFLRDDEKLPVDFVSLHNEGEDFYRWPDDGGTADKPSHDYNLFWPPEQVADFLGFIRGMLDKQGLRGVGVTPGETSNWLRFSDWGYAEAIASDPKAVRGLGLITSHGFVNFRPTRWFADFRSLGNDILREKNPSLRSWVTSQSWSQMDANFVAQLRGNIYVSKVNGIIPWAAIQRPAKWVGGDPNPGKAFGVDEQGKLTVEPGYYFYKQACSAGQPGMLVAHVTSTDAEVTMMAFARAKTSHPDALVLINTGAQGKPVTLAVKGTAIRSFETFRTSPSERYQPLGTTSVEAGMIRYAAPPGSVTTFFAK